MSLDRLPDTGELQRRVQIKVWSDGPNAAFGLDQTFGSARSRWAKVEPIYGLANRGDAQTGEVPTHLFWFRYGTGTKPEEITATHVIEWAGRRYRVLNAINVGDAQRFTRVTTKDLGSIA